MTSDTVFVTGIICMTFWLIAYAGIIYRGFKDKTFGMPITALAANLSWEASYSFFINPFGDRIHLLSIPWFLVDLLIFWQVLKYGANDFENAFVRNNFKLILFGAVAIAFPVVYLSFFEFNDPGGQYTGFGINFMMSFLFVAMLLRRNSTRGQSIYIAVAKFLGTFFAWLASGFAVTTSTTNQWPESVTSFVVDSVSHSEYPLTPLINYLYLVIFLVDLLYISMLYRRLKEAGLRPWRHF